MTQQDRGAREAALYAAMRAQWWRAADGRLVLLGITYYGQPCDFDRLTADEYQHTMQLVAKVHGITDFTHQQ